MSLDCPLRGPATGARLQNLGLPDIYKQGAPSRNEQRKMRKSYKAHAKANGDEIGGMDKRQYKSVIRRSLVLSIRAENQARWKERESNRLNSLNPVKAAQVQAIRDAWARVKAKQA